MPPGAEAIRSARFTDLSPARLYALLRLRVDVFVVEQGCPYAELDGRDAEPDTEHAWVEDAAGPVTYLRVLREADGVRIGRVCTRADARGAGRAARLMEWAVRRHADDRIVLDAQSYLAAFYARSGFAVTGPEYVEDGIPHVPMARPAGPSVG
jgi:ElaA protein